MSKNIDNDISKMAFDVTKITDLNQEQPFPIPVINPKTGREKVTAFYALPLMTALSVGTYLIHQIPVLCLVAFLLALGLMICFEKYQFTQANHIPHRQESQ
jgi:hypothetical protein